MSFAPALTVKPPLDTFLQQLAAAMVRYSMLLSADVTVPNTGAYADGPSVTVAVSGTYFAVGTVAIIQPAAGTVSKLWDGASQIGGTGGNTLAAGTWQSTLCGLFVMAASGVIKISVKSGGAAGTIKASVGDGNSASALYVFRLGP